MNSFLYSKACYSVDVFYDEPTEPIEANPNRTKPKWNLTGNFSIIDKHFMFLVCLNEFCYFNP